MTRLSKDLLLPLIDEVRRAAQAASTQGPVGHASLLSKINNLLLAAETPLETIYRIGHQSWQNAAVRVALDLRLFNAIVKGGSGGISAEELASNSGGDAVLIARIMRVLSAMGLCSECGTERYVASAKTEILTLPQGIYSFKTWIDICMPTASRLPQYLRKHNYQNPHQSASSPFAYAFGDEFWSWLSQNPEHSAVFNGFMGSRRQGRPSWFDTYSVEQELIPAGELDRDAVLLIDVGGNQGHDLVNLKLRYPSLPGKIILQDLPQVVANVDLTDKGITAMGHDFFTPQPVKNARAYHFRAIFHDWPDEQCRQILLHTASAMKPGFSKLLISEFVLADTNAALFPASLDLQMMGLHAGMERSEKQWRSLLGSAGLAIVKIWQVLPGGESVIEAVLIRS